MTKAEFIKLAKQNGHTDKEIDEVLAFTKLKIDEIKKDALEDGIEIDWTMDNYPYEKYCFDFLFVRYGR